MRLRQSALNNQILTLLEPADFEALAAHLEPVDLPKSYVVAEAEKPITHYYFLESGIGSIVGRSPEGLKAEVGLVGRDGIMPTAAILGCDSIVHDITVQVAGHGYRIEAAQFKKVLGSNSGLHAVLLRFVQVLSTQSASTALSNAVHHVEERLARWLLMCHDRVDGNQIALTHEYISIMLAVRRPSVTTALHVLEGNRFIHSTRGLVTIRDREGLKAFAADAYGIPEAEYGRLLGPLHKH
ncbi:MAG TPA: Crp/Fnr family transcriptional regulator [Kaistia sp.]|nr:Crp/Fnr family transcriptional regulator [Kaistia sp.]